MRKTGTFVMLGRNVPEYTTAHLLFSHVRRHFRIKDEVQRQ